VEGAVGLNGIADGGEGQLHRKGWLAMCMSEERAGLDVRRACSRGANHHPVADKA
jgi:hypothetical protein